MNYFSFEILFNLKQDQRHLSFDSCHEEVTKMTKDTEKILSIDNNVGDKARKRRKSTHEQCCVHILKQIRPHWKKCDIILRKLTSTAWIGYSVEDISEKLFIRIWDDFEAACFHIGNAQLYCSLGLYPRILGTFSHGYVMEHVSRSDQDLLHHPSVYPLVASKLGYLHRYVEAVHYYLYL